MNMEASVSRELNVPYFKMVKKLQFSRLLEILSRRQFLPNLLRPVWNIGPWASEDCHFS